MSFTTIAKMQTFLTKETLTTQETAEITLLIELIDGVISSYCGWNILAEDRVLYLNGNGASEIDLRAYPINTISEVLVDDVNVTADLSIDAENGTLYFTSGSTFPLGKRNVKVTGNIGYGNPTTDDDDVLLYPPVPNELVYAANYLVTINYNRIKDESIGANKARFNEIEKEYDTSDLPKLVTRVLDRYRLLSVM